MNDLLLNSEEESSLLEPGESTPEKIIVNDSILLDKCPNSTYKEPINPDLKYLEKNNYLGEFETKSEVNKVLDNLGIDHDKNLEWGNIKGFIQSQTDLLNYFESIPYKNENDPKIKSVQDALNKLLYVNLTVSLNLYPSIAEIGETISQIKYSWKYNKIIKSLSFNSERLDPSRLEYILKGPINKNITGILKSSDGISSKTSYSTLHFYPGIYYGCSNKLSINSNDILKFNRVPLRSNRYTSITVNAKEGLYIYICIPVSFGKASFESGGFEGGFELINSDFKFEKYKGTITSYYIYKSDYAGLGNTTIKIN